MADQDVSTVLSADGNQDIPEKPMLESDMAAVEVKSAVPPHVFISSMVGGCLLPTATGVCEQCP